MKIVSGLDQFKKKPAKRLILAIGNFDGFHLGHQKLLAYVTAQAKKYRALAAVLTFRQHPQIVLHDKRNNSVLERIVCAFNSEHALHTQRLKALQIDSLTTAHIGDGFGL